MSLRRILFFLVFAGGIMGSLHYYAWARLVRDPQLPPPWATIAAWTIIFLGVILVTAMPSSFVLPRSVSGPIMWVAFVWMGLAFFVVVLLALSDLARVIGFVARLTTGTPKLDPDRRLLLKRAIASVVTLGSLALGAYGLAEGLGRVRVKKIRVALRRVPPRRSGYRIVQLSDIHVGPTIGRAFIEDLVTRTNELEPDLVVITGDLVDGTVAALRDAVAPLAGLKSKDGVLFVTGNHEYYSGVDEWLAHLPSLGIRVLRNERITIGEGPDAIDIAGVDDWSARGFGEGHGADLKKALEGRDRGRAVILLAHQPKQIYEAAEGGVDLQLSGHTHGGQMFPFGYLVRLQQPYVAGFYMHEGTALYVSRGTGYWGPPMRVGAPAEITLIELATA